MKTQYKKIHELIKSSKSAAMVGHIRPDGDCIGSCVAMALALRGLEYQTADIYIDGEIPNQFSYMSCFNEIITAPLTADFNKNYDLLIILDCADESRLGSYTELRKYCRNVICFDHHLNTAVIADELISDKNKASVGEILFDFFKSASIEISKDMATALYTSVSSDTGCFLFPSTTSYTHAIAAELIKKGINIEEINYYNFRVNEFKNITVLVYALKSIRFFAKKQIAVVHLPFNIIKKYQIDDDIRHKIKTYVSDIKGVRASVLLSESERDNFYISLRSHGELNVGAVAESFGGGGHKNAAGFNIKGKYNNVIKDIITQLEKIIQ